MTQVSLKDYLVVFTTSLMEEGQQSAYIYRTTTERAVIHDFARRLANWKQTFGDDFTMEILSLNEVVKETPTLITVK